MSNNLDWIDDKSPIMIAAHTPVLQAISLMGQAQSGCVLAMEGETLVGILTEQDIVQICAAGVNLGDTKTADVMHQSPITIRRSQIHNTDEVMVLLHKHRINYLT